MIKCDECDDEIVGQSRDGRAVRPRRFRCVHCGLLLCGYCLTHEGHVCGPGHSEKDCRDIAQQRAMSPAKRAKFRTRQRARTLTLRTPEEDGPP